MNLADQVQAFVYFLKAREMLKIDMINQLKLSGKDFSGQEIEMAELLKPSIFDTDRIKALKANLEEIQIYIDEIENVADKEKFEKIKAEMKLQRKEEVFEVPAGFGKPQENAD